jgi:hypothetical protein
MFGSVHLLDQMALAAGDPIQGWGPSFRLIYKRLHMIRKLAHMWSMAAETLRFVLSHW